jgi:putative oxidoreductase
MEAIERALEAWAPRALSVLRIFVGLLFLQHGLQKLLGFPAPLSFSLSPLLYLATLIEIVGGVLLIVGAFTRPAAFFMSGEMAIAYLFVMARPMKSFFPLANGGELEAFYSVVFLYFVFAGGGAWSLDRLVLKRR